MASNCSVGDMAHNSRAELGHSTGRSSTSFANNLGQTQATTKVLDLANLLTSRVGTKNLVASGDIEIFQ